MEKATFTDCNSERATTIPKGSTLQAIGSGSAWHLDRDDDMVCSAWKHVAGYNPGSQCSAWLRTYRLNYGKTLKVHKTLYILDDQNITDQGLDQTGAGPGNPANPTGTDDEGNLYGSSRSVYDVTDGLPMLGEGAGRVNYALGNMPKLALHAGNSMSKAA